MQFHLVKTKHRRKKIGAIQKQGSSSEPLVLGLSHPTKYFANFVVFLPLSITKKIFNHLDRASILNCLKVSKGWKYLAQEVIDEKWTSIGKDNNGGRSAKVSMFNCYLHQHFNHHHYHYHKYQHFHHHC